MSTSEHVLHLENLQHAYQKRLRVLEWKAAVHGYNTPAEVMLEIDDLRETVCRMEQELARARATCMESSRLPQQRNGQVVHVAQQDTKRVEIVLEGDFDLTPERQDAVIRALAALVDIPPEEVSIVRTRKGSIILDVELPEAAAHRLLALYTTQGPLISEMGIVSVRAVPIPPDEYCAAILAAVNAEYGWGLDSITQATYCSALRPYMVFRYRDMRRIIINYHLDHPTVEALGEPQHPWHNAVWTVWIGDKVLSMLQHQYPEEDWSADLADVTQLVRAHLWKVLSSGRYRYHFRLVTLFNNALSKSVMTLRIAEPYRRTQSLDQVRDEPISEAQHPETVVHARLLAARVDAVLSGHPDSRLLTIFRLWAYGNQSIESISQQVQMSPPQVRVLLQEARTILQRDPVIQTWQDT